MSLETELLLRLVLAALFGLILGIEREYIGKPAGMRTYALVSLGSALFTIISRFGFADVTGTGFDPSRVAAQIVSGIGFLGAGVIVLQGLKLRGVTTASGIWVSAAIGMAVGTGLYLLALTGALIAVVLMAVMRKFDLERRLGGGKDE